MSRKQPNVLFILADQHNAKVLVLPARKTGPYSR